MEDSVMWALQQKTRKQGKVILGWKMWKKNKHKKKKKNSKEEVQVHPMIPWELSHAFQIARPYRPSMMVELETISEAAEEGRVTPFYEIPSKPRTPLYFVGGKRPSRRFRLQRYVKLLWRVHSSRIKGRFQGLMRFIFKDKKPQRPSSPASIPDDEQES